MLDSLQNEKYNKSVSNDNTQLIANLNKKSWRSHASSGKFGALLVFGETFLLESSSSFDNCYPHKIISTVVQLLQISWKSTIYSLYYISIFQDFYDFL